MGFIAKTQFPAGKYYVGDLCYVFNDEQWDMLCTAIFCAEPVLEGYVPRTTVPGMPDFYWHHTAYGDGCYWDEEGREYGVDAGLIGIMPVEACDQEKLADIRDLGHIIDFKDPFDCSYEDGKFFLGDDITIDTDPEWDDDAEDDEDSDHDD